MGANQSTGASSGAAQATEVKTSYYTLLGVERQATEEEIKKAYRKNALELHPDRNYGNVEQATKLFTEIQAAYEVLADPQERSWYDSHEQIILGGQEPGNVDNYEETVGITSADELTGLLRKFNRNVDFSDSPSGFFGFLREKFEQLAKEEESAAFRQGTDCPDYPSFGHKDDSYEDVVKEFYAYWGTFSTIKNFAWKHKYRKSDAEDRWGRRAIDKENARFAEAGKREFNDAVRTLVAFVRKRDPRFTPNTQTDDERAKAMRDAAKAQAARQRAENEAKMNEAVPEWATRREPEELELSEEEVEEEHFECMACRKTFKSEKQFDAHEKSKKHQKAVHALKKKMRKESAHLGLDDGFSSSGVATPQEADEDLEEDFDDIPASATTATAPAPEIPQSSVDVATEAVDKISLSPSEETGEPQNRIDDTKPKVEGERQETADTKKVSRETDEEDSEEDTDSEASQEPKLEKSSSQDIEEKDVETKPKMGKAAQKRAKRAAKQTEDDQSELKHKCASCNAGFSSKTRLFQHIKDFGHAAPVANMKQAGKGGKSKKKK